MSGRENHGVTDSPQPAEDLSSRVVELLRTGGQSTLATHSIKHQGFPFCSVMPYALSDDGLPMFLISSMANHTRNLNADGRACLLVADAETGDRLAGSRVSVMGRVVKTQDEEIAAARNAYLAVHPESQQWVDFGDFAFFKMEIEDIYIVAGFGSMGWVSTEEYFEKHKAVEEKN